MKKWIMALTLGTAAAGGAAVAQDAMRPRDGRTGMMMRADTDGDGVISRAEYQAQVDKRFARLDANGNGRIDEGEGFGGRRGRSNGGSAMSGASTPASQVGMTRDAYRAAAMARFERIDANRDGRLDPAEMRGAIRAAMSNRGAPPSGR